MRFFTLAFFSILLPSAAVSQDDVRLMTEEFAPYQYYEGEGENREFKGISVEIVQALQKDLGHIGDIKPLPWSRAFKLLKKKPNVALFSMARTAERESLFKWVGPLAKLEMVFFASKGSGVSFSSLEEARNLRRIGVTKNVATHEILRDLDFSNLDVLQSGADEKNLPRLIKGRIDVWPTAYFAGIYSARKMGLLENVMVIPNVTIMSGNLYIGFNIDTSDKLVERWQNALRRLKESGFVADVIAKYDQ